MTYTCRPTKLSIYVNTGLKKAAEIKAITGCTTLINGGLYDMKKFIPNCHLKVSGKILAKDIYKYWGFAWNDNTGFVNMVEDYSMYDNYICRIPLIHNGFILKMQGASKIEGTHFWTALGTFKDGRVWIFYEQVKRTAEEVQQIAYEAGVYNAILLDGGGSTQGISPAGTLTSTRIVHNYICIWEDENTGKDTEETKMDEPLICLDAGHGKTTAGKQCLKSIDPNETKEWVLNDRIARYTAEGLSKYYCKTMRVDDITGATDVSLYNRVKKANDANAKIFLSCHANAGIDGKSGGGICVFISENASATSKLLQDAIYAETVARTGLKGNRAEPKLVKSFYVIANTDMPAILGEYGFMDSTVDTPIILTDDFARKCAEGIVAGVVKVLTLVPREVETPTTTVPTNPANTIDVPNILEQLIANGVSMSDLLKAISNKI